MIHKTAIIDPKSKIEKNVEIGPYTVIGPNVEIEDGTKIQSHVCITGNTKIGKNNRIFPFASIGNEPQDLKYKGEDTKLIIGNGNTISCLLYTSPSPRDLYRSRMPSSA